MEPSFRREKRLIMNQATGGQFSSQETPRVVHFSIQSWSSSSFFGLDPSVPGSFLLLVVGSSWNKPASQQGTRPRKMFGQQKEHQPGSVPFPFILKGKKRWTLEFTCSFKVRIDVTCCKVAGDLPKKKKSGTFLWNKHCPACENRVPLQRSHVAIVRVQL